MYLNNRGAARETQVKVDNKSRNQQYTKYSWTPDIIITTFITMINHPTKQ